MITEDSDDQSIHKGRDVWAACDYIRRSPKATIASPSHDNIWSLRKMATAYVSSVARASKLDFELMYKLPHVLARVWWLHHPDMSGIIALWAWFSHDVLPVTCYEHGPPSIATVHFLKFSIATNILFN